MPAIKSVALAGASGTLGTYILKALVDAQFHVTVLTRTEKPGAFDSSVKVIEVDFTSIESLTAALRGIDGVVSTVGAFGLLAQNLLIDAAVAAGVQRFIPSDFGCVTTSPKVAKLPHYEEMADVRKHLQASAGLGKITWTVLACGGFLEYLFKTPLFLDFKAHKANLFDEGDNRVSSTSLPYIGKAVAAIFQNLEATKNRVVYSSEVTLSQNGILEIAKELKPDVKWEITKQDTKQLLKEGMEEFEAGGISMPVMMKVLGGTAFGGEEYGGAFGTNDNELLGIKPLTHEALKQMISEQI